VLSSAQPFSQMRAFDQWQLLTNNTFFSRAMLSLYLAVVLVFSSVSIAWRKLHRVEARKRHVMRKHAPTTDHTNTKKIRPYHIQVQYPTNSTTRVDLRVVSLFKSLKRFVDIIAHSRACHVRVSACETPTKNKPKTRADIRRSKLGSLSHDFVSFRSLHFC